MLSALTRRRTNIAPLKVDSLVPTETLRESSVIEKTNHDDRNVEYNGNKVTMWLKSGGDSGREFKFFADFA